jgi:polyhydroxyalkanoate synthesis regulator phasin
MWTAIALICVAAIAGEAYRKRHQGSVDKEIREQLDQVADRIDRMDADLRERVETLERIVTDSKEDLKRQFDHLDKAS